MISGMTEPLAKLRNFRNNFSTRPITPLTLALFDSQNRPLLACENELQLRTSEPSRLDAQLIQSSKEAGVESIFTVIISNSYEFPVWARLTLTECTSTDSEIVIKAGASPLEYETYSSLDYLFELPAESSLL